MNEEKSRQEIIDEFITAAWQNETDVIRDLAHKYLYLIDQKQPYLNEALFTACNAAQALTARQLVEEFGANVNAVNSRGMTPLHEAMNSADMDTAEMLVNNGANVNARDTSSGATHGWTPLHYAAMQASIAMIELLLKKGAAAAARNAKGETAAEMAKKSKNKSLIAAGALIDKLSGNTPPPPRHQRRKNGPQP